MSDFIAINSILLSILSDEKFIKNVVKILEKYKQVKDVYHVKVGDANLNAFAKGNDAEISKLIEEIKNTQGVKKVEAKVLNPL